MPQFSLTEFDSIIKKKIPNSIFAIRFKLLSIRNTNSKNRIHLSYSKARRTSPKIYRLKSWTKHKNTHTPKYQD